MPTQPSENEGWDILEGEEVRIIADKNYNLHSASTEGGLLFVPARRAVTVPEDVKDHPSFARDVKHGHIAILEGIKLSKRAMQLARNPLSDEEARKGAPSRDLPPSTIPAAKDLDESDEDEDDEDEDEDDDPIPASKPVTAPPVKSVDNK